MTANLAPIAGLSREAALMHQANLKDFKEALTLTTQEMAEKRAKEYFNDRTFRAPSGIINSFFLYLTVQSGDATVRLDAFTIAPQLVKDLQQLEAIKQQAIAAKPDEVKHALTALFASGFSKEVLKKLFDAPTWNMIYPGKEIEKKACSDILAAIEAITPGAEKVEQVAKPALAAKRKEEPAIREQDKKAKNDSIDDAAFAQELQDEELAKSLEHEPQAKIDSDAAYAAQLAKEEFGFVEGASDNDEHVQDDLELARALQNEEDERLSILALQELKKKGK